MSYMHMYITYRVYVREVAFRNLSGVLRVLMKEAKSRTKKHTTYMYM